MTTSCVCPKNLDQYHMIEYPGFVKNVDKALDTLGGLESVEKVFSSQKDRLELKFRKLDPLAHAAYGDRTPKRCLIIRIRKSKKNDQSDCKGFSFEVIGKIQTSYRFDTLAEFQWLPMQRTNIVENIKADELLKGVEIKRTPESLNPRYVSIIDDILPIKNPFDNKLKNFNPEAPLLVLPALFSRFDTPREIHQPHPKFRSQEMRAEFERQQSMSIIGKTRKKRSTMSCLLNFGDDVPMKPPEKLLKEKESLSSQERGMIPILVSFFERQKVWSKAALCYELNCSPSDIKFILPLVSYHYLTGPFRTMWVKYGYNPHQDSSSKILQTLDFRVKSPLDQQEYSRRSINQYKIPLRINPEKSKNSQVDLKSVISMPSTSQNLEEDFEDSLGMNKSTSNIESMCKFTRTTIPPARQLSYQLKDIDLDEVQAIIHSNDGKEPSECSERDGWLPEGSIDKIRKIMTKVLSQTYESMSSQLSLDSTSKSNQPDPEPMDLYEAS